jgi:ATP-dependent helicase/nuclease subunit A
VTATLALADAEVRSTALDPAASFIVQAPAGSGKTELLTQRLLAMLAGVDEPEEIVAMTFTRKAAGEMQQRVLMVLEDPGKGQEITRRLARRALERDRERGWQLTENPNRLRITTIDSLCLSLVQRLPLLSGGIPPNVVEDAGRIYREAAGRTLAEFTSRGNWSRSLAELLRHQDANWRGLIRLLLDLLARRDQWLGRLDIGGPQSRAVLEAALSRCVTEHLQNLARLFDAEQADQLLRLARQAGRRLQLEEDSSAIRSLAEMSAMPGHAAADLPGWLGLAELLLTAEGNWRRQVNKRHGFPAPSQGRDREEKALLKQAKDEMQELLARLEVNPALASLLHGVRELPLQHYSEGQWRLLESLSDVLKLTLAQLLMVFAEEGQVDFPALAQGALVVLGDSDNPTDLSLALDYRIRHLMVDEFQDTSRGQFKLLECLTAGWSAGDGHSLFLVGDPMQSIYGFRDADVGLFRQVMATRRLGQVPVEPLKLAVNFRASAPLIDWTNQVFSTVFPQPDTTDLAAVPFERAVVPGDVAAASDSEIAVHAITQGDQDGEAMAAAELAARACQAGKRVAILVRSRIHLSRIVPTLQRMGVAYRAVDVDPLSERQSILDLLSLSLALNDPTDRVALLSVLRAPWCGLDLADLELLVGTAATGPLLPRLMDAGVLAGLSPDGRRRAARVAAALKVDSGRLGRVGLRRRVEAAWLQLGGPACLESESELIDVDRYFARLDDFDRAGLLIDRQGLLDALQDLYAEPVTHSDQALQLMTVHRAKGLEFDVVIVPGLGRQLASGDEGLLVWYERHNALGNRDLLIAARSSQEDGTTYDYIRKLKQRARAHEELRLLYVAATRAKQCLHLLGECKRIEQDGVEKLRPAHPSSGFAALWPAIADTVIDFEEPVAAEQAAAEINQNLKRLVADWAAPVWARPGGEIYELATVYEVQDFIEFDWAEEIIRAVGTVVHRFLDRFAKDALHGWSAERIAAERPVIRRCLELEGLLAEQTGAAVDLVVEALTNALQDQRGRWLLGAHDAARSELALTGVHAGQVFSGVIDRTFIDEQGVRWVVDYKTSQHGGGDLQVFLDSEWQRYRDQLYRYAGLLHLSDNQRPIRMALYFPLLKAWREAEFEPDEA